MRHMTICRWDQAFGMWHHICVDDDGDFDKDSAVAPLWYNRDVPKFAAVSFLCEIQIERNNNNCFTDKQTRLQPRSLLLVWTPDFESIPSLSYFAISGQKNPLCPKIFRDTPKVDLMSTRTPWFVLRKILFNQGWLTDARKSDKDLVKLATASKSWYKNLSFKIRNKLQQLAWYGKIHK